MTFLCKHKAFFTQNTQLNNITNDCCFNYIDISNTIRCKQLLCNNLFVKHVNIYDQLIELSNNDIIENNLNSTSTNKLSNQAFTQQFSLKQNAIYDLSNEGFISAGQNINIGPEGTIHLSNDKIYFMIYFIGNFGNTFGDPRRLPLTTIKIQNPNTGIINNAGYVIQESGLYKLRYQVRILEESKITKMALALTRGNNTIYLKTGGDTPLTSRDNTILYYCEQGDEISVMITETVVFEEYAAYYGSNGSTDMMVTFLFGIKL